MSVAFIVVGLFCGVTAIIDMAINGSQYTGWAGWGLGIALLCALGARLSP